MAGKGPSDGSASWRAEVTSGCRTCTRSQGVPKFKSPRRGLALQALSHHPLLPRQRREEEPRPGRRPLDSSLRGWALPPPRPDLPVAAAERGASALGAAVPCRPAKLESPAVMVCAVAWGA